MADAPPVGTYCATAGAVFTSKEALTAHYKSDFHRCVRGFEFARCG
jgi:hypothetical protein